MILVLWKMNHGFVGTHCDLFRMRDTNNYIERLDLGFKSQNIFKASIADDFTLTSRYSMVG